MKKNNVAVDIVSFGSETENEEKLTAFHEAVNSGDNSHLVTVPPGMILSDSLFGSPIFQGEGGGGYGGGDGDAAASTGGGGGGGFEFGIDPSLDPELALALRVSMEEERARQTAANAGSGTAIEAVPAAEGSAQGQAQASEGPVPMDEDALLQQALAMSMQVDQPESAAEQPDTTMASAKQDEAMEDMDEELRTALQISMQDHGDTSAEASAQQVMSYICCSTFPLLQTCCLLHLLSLSKPCVEWLSDKPSGMFHPPRQPGTSLLFWMSFNKKYTGVLC